MGRKKGEQGEFFHRTFHKKYRTKIHSIQIQLSSALFEGGVH